MVEIREAATEDSVSIKDILQNWLEEEEVEHYISAIDNNFVELKYDSHYYVATVDSEVIGVAGLRMPNPKLVSFAKTKNPAELNMLYVAKDHRGGKGVGSKLLEHIEKEARDRDYTELIVRSAEKFIESGWGFYDKKGFERVGTFTTSTGDRSQIWVKGLD